jgi:hypothetical protein
VRERHRAVLDEGYGFALLLHRHHDVEAGGAHLGNRRLQLRIERLDHATPFRAGPVPAETEIAHQVPELHEAAKVLILVVLGKFHEQDGFGIAAHDRIDRGPEHRDLARQTQHRAIDQLDRDRSELDDVLRGVHRLNETAEVAGADRAPAEQRRKFQLDAGGESQRAFGADENMRQVEIVAAGQQRVEIVAADPSLDLRETRFDLVGFLRCKPQQIVRERQQG